MMFWKNRTEQSSPEPMRARADRQGTVFDKPKILLVDLEDDTRESLVTEGFNAVSGSFGRPYKVNKTSSYRPVIHSAQLPNLAEQEIIVIDLFPRLPLDVPPGEKHLPNEELDWWVRCPDGTIDPRPLAMTLATRSLDRILANGGIFVLFADSRTQYKFAKARIDRYDSLDVDSENVYDTWSFLSSFNRIHSTHDLGREISPMSIDSPLVRVLFDHLAGAEFHCTLDPHFSVSDSWMPLALNKYQAAVSAAIKPSANRAGWVLIFPNIKDKASFVRDLVKHVLPELSPQLFPHISNAKWLNREEYQLPSVLAKRQQIREVQEASHQKITELEQAITSEKLNSKYLFDLLDGTGDELVRAVMKALTVLGFQKIIDVDAQMKRTGKGGALREDLQIHDRSPVLIVDVKGVGGRVADADALQAQKHTLIYMQENKTVDVKGLTIINHERHMPPLDRDNSMPFRQEILDNAALTQLGVMTTWDLYRLTRNMLRQGWPPGQVIPVFYRSERISPIPEHYVKLGQVKQVWQHAFSVEITSSSLKVGEKIAIEFSVDFEEMVVGSLRLNDQDVASAGIGQEVGVKNQVSTWPKLKSGQNVYVARA